MVARQESYNCIRPCVLCIAGKIVESVAGLSRARYIVKLCGFNIILSDPMDITETEQQKNDYFSQ